MIEDLKEMMKERLEAFMATSKRLPQRILVYRDGVSEVSHFVSTLFRLFFAYYLFSGPVQTDSGY